MLGICLGAQLLAVAAGAEVRRSPSPEIGWFDVARTGRAPRPAAGRVPPRFLAYEWHSYTFALPAGATELARSAICSQAYRLGDHAWCVQFHPEVTPEIVRRVGARLPQRPGRDRDGLRPARAHRRGGGAAARVDGDRPHALRRRSCTAASAAPRAPLAAAARSAPDPPPPPRLTAGLAGRAVVRAAASGANSSGSSAPASQAASSSGPGEHDRHPVVDGRADLVGASW